MITIIEAEPLSGAWHIPWQISDNASIFYTNNVEITRFIKQYTPDDFMESHEEMNVQTLFQIVGYLYRKNQ